MIDYNFLVLREAVDKVFELRNKSLQSQQDAKHLLSVETKHEKRRVRVRKGTEAEPVRMSTTPS